MEGEARPNSERRRRQKRQRRLSETMSYETSVENLSREGRETLVIVNQKRRKPLNSISNGNSSTFFDNTSPPYAWLRSGWLVEERRMLSNRLYRYYYDPKGQMYNTRREVDNICEDIDKHRVLIILDD